MRRHQFTYISKEIIQHEDVEGLVDSVAVENHLHQALLRPTGKYASSKNLLPDGRYFEDYLSTKYFKKLKYVGFSINPEHIQGMHII
jgi:hypothetical protein